MAIVVMPNTEARLVRHATIQGVGIEVYTDRILNAALDWAELPAEDEVAAISEGMSACKEGRLRPFADFASEHRARYTADR